jgi:hypothetical protein
MMVRVGGARPPTFTLSTITGKVVVYAPAERTDALLLFLLYPFPLCGTHQSCMAGLSRILKGYSKIPIINSRILNKAVPCTQYYFPAFLTDLNFVVYV